MTSIVRVGDYLSPQTGTTHFHAELRLPDKGCAIKGLVVKRKDECFTTRSMFHKCMERSETQSDTKPRRGHALLK